MTSKAKYAEPTPEQVAKHQEIIETLCRLSRGTSALTEPQAKDFLDGLLRYVQGGRLRHASDGNSYFVEDGEPCDVEVPALSYLPVFEPHLQAALRAGNIALAACLTLSVWKMHQYEGHMALYGQMILNKQRTGRASAERRKAEERTPNTRTLLEAWERDNGIALSLASRAKDIADCAAKIERSEITVKNVLKARRREARRA